MRALALHELRGQGRAVDEGAQHTPPIATVRGDDHFEDAGGGPLLCERPQRPRQQRGAGGVDRQADREPWWTAHVNDSYKPATCLATPRWSCHLST